MPSFYNINEALEEMLPTDVRPKLVSHLKRADLHQDAQIISNIETHFNSIIRSSDPFTKQVKDYFEWQKDFSNYLSSLQNTLVYDEEDFHKITGSQDSFISELHQNMGNQFSLFESIATGTSWDAQANRRVLNKAKVYQLKYDPTAFYITFLAPSSQAFLHVVFFMWTWRVRRCVFVFSGVEIYIVFASYICVPTRNTKSGKFF